MTHLDPRDPRRADIDPLMPDGPVRPGLDPLPYTDPRIDRSSGNSWPVVGGLAAALVLVIVLLSMFGGDPRPNDQAPGVTTSQPAPAQQPAPDSTTTGSTPRRQAP